MAMAMVMVADVMMITFEGSSPIRCTAPSRAVFNMMTAEVLARAPRFARHIGVRTEETMTTSLSARLLEEDDDDTGHAER